MSTLYTLEPGITAMPRQYRTPGLSEGERVNCHLQHGYSLILHVMNKHLPSRGVGGDTGHQVGHSHICRLHTPNKGLVNPYEFCAAEYG